jgi:hypothetical protein
MQMLINKFIKKPARLLMESNYLRCKAIYHGYLLTNFRLRQRMMKNISTEKEKLLSLPFSVNNLDDNQVLLR